MNDKASRADRLKKWRHRLFPLDLLLDVLLLAMLSSRELPLPWERAVVWTFTAATLLWCVAEGFTAVRSGRQYWEKLKQRSDWLGRAARDMDYFNFVVAWVSLAVNVLYCFFKTVAGICSGLMWMELSGLYYMCLSVISFLLKRRVDTHVEADGRAAWKAYRRTGVLLMTLTLIVVGTVLDITLAHRVMHVPGALIGVFIAYAVLRLLYVLVCLVVNNSRQNRYLDALSRLGVACTLVAVLPIQASVLLNGDLGAQTNCLLNALTGIVVCGLLAVMSVLMIVRADRALREECAPAPKKGGKPA